MLMIVLLLSSSNHLLGQTNIDYPSTGEWTQTDTTSIAVPINLIKQANVKMIERFYLIEINKQQDSIIIMKDDYINEQHKVIIDFQKRIETTNQLNEDIKKDLDRQKRNNKIIGGVVGSAVIGLLIGLIAK